MSEALSAPSRPRAAAHARGEERRAGSPGLFLIGDRLQGGLDSPQKAPGPPSSAAGGQIRPVHMAVSLINDDWNKHR